MRNKALLRFVVLLLTIVTISFTFIAPAMSLSLIWPDPKDMDDPIGFLFDWALSIEDRLFYMQFGPSVSSFMIVDGAVRTADLAGGAVTRVKLANNSITSKKIINGQVKTSDIAMRAIKSGRIANRSITSAKIRNGHVRTTDIALGAVLSGRIANSAVTSGKIRDGTIMNTDISGSAAISDSKINYLTRTGHLSIPVSELSPLFNSYDYGKGTVLYMLSGSGSFYAAAHLPQGAVVKKFTFATADNTDTAYTRAKLRRINNSNPGVTLDMASVDTSGQANSAAWTQQSTSSISSPTIDNRSFSYVVDVYLGGPTTFLAAGPIVIEYTYSSPGD